LTITTFFGCGNEKKVPISSSEKDDTVHVRIGDSLFLTKVFIDQNSIIENYRETSDSLLFKRAIDTLFKKYYPAWNDCFNYPTEDLFEFHKEYATSNDTALGRRMLLLEEKNIDAIGAEIIEKVSTVSGFRPSGTHYMIYMFDTQEFNMGGCDKNLMYINLNNKDFSIDWFKRVFPHELNHQIYEETLPSANQDMVLWTILDEGLATYFENKINGSSVAESIFISEDELNWCIENEKDILKKTLPILYSTERKDDMLLRKKGGLMIGSPGQLNYFLGFRIIERYVEKYGDESWKDIYVTPVEEVFTKSGYKEFVLSNNI